MLSDLSVPGIRLNCAPIWTQAPGPHFPSPPSLPPPRPRAGEKGRRGRGQRGPGAGPAVVRTAAGRFPRLAPLTGHPMVSPRLRGLLAAWARPPAPGRRAAGLPPPRLVHSSKRCDLPPPALGRAPPGGSPSTVPVVGPPVRLGFLSSAAFVSVLGFAPFWLWAGWGLALWSPWFSPRPFCVWGGVGCGGGVGWWGCVVGRQLRPQIEPRPQPQPMRVAR